MFEKMASLQIQLLLLMIVGFLIKKKKILDDKQQSGLSELLIYVILPATIIKSFISSGNKTGDTLKNCLFVVAICFLIEIVLIVIAPKLLRYFGEDKARVMEYGLLVPNSGFIGLPIIEYMYDATTLMYASIYLIPLNVVMWTIALSLYTKEKDMKSGLRKVVTHPCIIAIFIGFILMISNIKLPSAINGAIEMASKASCLISMLTVGTILADIEWYKLFDLSTITYTVIRLVILPLLVYLILDVIGVNETIVLVSTLMTAMPCGAMCPVLAKKYDCDYKFAAKLILLSSIFSVITIPCLCLLF